MKVLPWTGSPPICQTLFDDLGEMAELSLPLTRQPSAQLVVAPPLRKQIGKNTAQGLADRH